MTGAATMPSDIPAGSVDEEFTAYVNARRRALLRTAYLLAGDYHAAEDLVQAALARAYASWKRIRDKGAVDAYVRRILLNEHLALWRRAWRRREHSVADLADYESSQPAVPELGIDDEMWNAIQALAPRQRAVIVLRYYEDLSEAETAAVLGCSAGTVKSTCHKSLAKLRQVLSTAPSGR